MPAILGGLDRFIGEVQGLAVLSLQHKETQNLGVNAALVEQIADGGEVTEGFGHFFAADINHAVVEPVAGEGVARGGFGLGDFVFVVGEGEVSAAHVDVDAVAEAIADHG